MGNSEGASCPFGDDCAHGHSVPWYSFPDAEQHFACYVMGAERWCHADTLEATSAGYRTLFLDSACNPDDLSRAGSLGAEHGVGQPDHFGYDPRDLRVPKMAAEARVYGNALLGQTVPSALYGKSLVYYSSPFDEETEISGFFRRRGSRSRLSGYRYLCVRP